MSCDGSATGLPSEGLSTLLLETISTRASIWLSNDSEGDYRCTIPAGRWTLEAEDRLNPGSIITRRIDLIPGQTLTIRDWPADPSLAELGYAGD